LATLSAGYLKELRRKRKLGAILGFAREQVTFVYPARVDQFSEPARNILPRTSTEDFLAMNNIMSALLRIHWSGEAKLKIAADFREEDRATDLILICSPFSNPAAETTLRELYQKYPSLPTFEREQASNRYYIRAGTEYYYSSTYDVVDRCIASGQRPEEAEMVDYGVIIKAPNPWDATNTVLLVAGIRGIGTWGAAEFLKKRWQDIIDRKRHDGQHRRWGPFAAVVEVKFSRGDLVGFRVMMFSDLD